MSFAVEFIDGPYKGEVRLLDGEVSSPTDLPAGLDLDGIRYAFVWDERHPGGGKTIDREKLPDPAATDFAYYLTKDPVELFHWWKSLTREAKLSLSANPEGPVPSECLNEVIKSGQLVIGAHWTSTQSGPDGFYLPDRVQEWIADHPLAVS